MSRANWNETCDICLPDGTPYRVAVPCRVVPQTRIFPDQFPNSMSHAWMTHPLPGLPAVSLAFLGGGKLEFDYTLCHLVAVPSGVPPQWYAINPEYVDNGSDPPYYRCRLLPLPIPF